MPTLNWIGKEAVVKHHTEVPFRLLEPVPELSCGDSDSDNGNLIVQGDNLHALKALLPRYAGQVKCIYIDPPYNTGNEGWVYNDNVNSPEIRKWLGEVVGLAFQQALFGDDAASRVAVTDQHAFEFHAQAYAPSRDYDGRFGNFDFRKHFYGRVGDFDSKEEFECACWLDIQAQQGRIQFWVRNLVRREGSSFFLQKADGRFYPDFLCQLPGSADQPGPMLAVEYKGADRWAGAEDDRLIGGLWANLPGGRCRFVMVKDTRWEWIEGQLSPSRVRQN